MDRDFDKEKIIDKMRSLRDKRDLELLNMDLEGINLNSDYQKELPKNKVLNVKYLGKIDFDEEKKGIYLIIEQKEKEDGTLIEVERYYTEDGEFLGGNNKADQFDFIVLNEKYMDREDLLEKLQNLDKEGLLDLNEIEDERIEKIATSLGIKKEEIEEIIEIEANTPVKEKDEPKTISNKEVEGLNIKEETSADTNLKGETLASKLGLAEKGITNVTKIARVTTTSLNKVSEEKNSNEDAFVAIKADGTAVVLGEDILKEDTRSGKNPNQENLTINHDGKVNKEDITTSYLIVNGNGEEYLQAGYDEASGKEIKYAMRSRQTGEFVATELQTQKTYEKTSDVREFLNDENAGMYEADDILKRDKNHNECGEKDVTIIDNDKDNDSHEHFQVEMEYIRAKARKIFEENEAIAEIFTLKEVEKTLEKRVEEKIEQIPIEEIIKETEMELEAETEHFKTRQK